MGLSPAVQCKPELKERVRGKGWEAENKEVEKEPADAERACETPRPLSPARDSFGILLLAAETPSPEILPSPPGFLAFAPSSALPYRELLSIGKGRAKESDLAQLS